MWVLITGGSGFIGENVAKGLRASNPDWMVRIFDIRPPDDGSLELVRGDIFDRSAVDGVVKGSDLVYHMVGMKDAWQAQQDPLVGRSHRRCPPSAAGPGRPRSL